MIRSTGSGCEFWWSYWRSVVSKTSYALFASLLLLAGCKDQRPNSGKLGDSCKPDGTCIGELVCVTWWNELQGTVFRCVPKQEK